MFFAYFDGDDIGPALELLLLDEHLQEAKEYSRSIITAFEATRIALVEKFNADIVIAGGDDLLVCFPKDAMNEADIETLRKEFFEECGRSISVGVGSSAAEAASNLRRAKLLGKDRLVTPPEVTR